MTKRGFIIASFLKSCGIHKKQRRLQAAATELQLLREAETVLGRKIWRNVEDIDLFRVNYWNLRNMIDERDQITDKIRRIKQKLVDIEENKRSKFQNANSSSGLEEKFHEQTERISQLEAEQEELTKIASNIRRLFDGSQAKLQSLRAANAAQEARDMEKANIAKLKEKFAELKNKKADIDERLKRRRENQQKIKEAIRAQRSSYKDQASSNYEVMGKANKAISSLSSRLGFLDANIGEQYTEIGNLLCKEYAKCKKCRKAAQSASKLVKVIKAIRQSIEYNHNLADR